MNEKQLIEAIRNSKFRKMSAESADMIDRMNKTKKRVENSKVKETSSRSITISSGI